MLTEKKYISEIDGLRAIAIIAVVINHINQTYLANGYLGVDLFFVVSGFVVTRSIFHSEKDFSLSTFYVKRILRLFPALAICLLFSVFISLLFLFPNISTSTIKTGSLSILGLGNIYLIKSAQNYFAQATSLNLLTHTWSLSVEEQFYLIFPILFYFFNNKKKTRTHLFVVVVLLSVSSLLLNFIISNQDIRYYSLLTRFWQISLGFLAFIASELNTKIKNNSLIINYSLLGVIIFLFSGTIYSGFFTSIVLCFAVALLLCQISTSQKTNICLDSKILTKIGKMSYSIYLWHWPVLAFFRNTVGLEGLKQLIAVFIISGFSIVSYVFIEQRFRYLKFLNTKKFLNIFLLITLLLSGILYCLSKQSFFIGNSETTFSKIDSALWEKGKCSVSASELVDEKLDYYSKCKLVDNKQSNTIFIIGDSYAQQVMPVIYDIAKEKEFSLVAMAASGCHPIPGLEIEREEGKFNCTTRLNIFLNLLNRHLREGDKVVLAFSHSYFIEDNVLKQGGLYLNQKTARSFLIKEYTKISDLIEKKKAEGYVLGNIPQLKTEPSLCYQRWSIFRHDCKLINIIDEKLTAQRIEIDNLINIASFKKLKLIKIMDLIRKKIGEKNLYYNSSHLSSSGSRQLKDIIIKNFKI